MGRCSVLVSKEYKTDAEAIAAWNTRTDSIPSQDAYNAGRAAGIREAAAIAKAWRECGHDFDVEAEILALLDNHPAPAGVTVPAELLNQTFAVQYNRNCPSPWLVRMPKGSAIIDMKPYSSFTPADELTVDALGFGKTFQEAADNAFRALSGDRT
jgi:hypothetical protein